MTDQLKIVVKSLKDFKNNLIILVPMLLSFGIGVLLAIFVLLQVLLGALIFRGANLSEGASLGLIAYSSFFFLLDFVIYLLILSYVAAAYYGTAADIVIRGNSSFRRLLQHGRTFLKSVLAYFAAKFVIFAAPLALIFVLAFSAFMISRAAGYITLAVSILLYVLFAIAFSVITIFNTPMLVSKKIGGFRLIVESFRYGKSNMEHVIITAAVSIALGIISYVFYLIFYVPSFIARIASGAMQGTGASLLLPLAAFVLEILASIVFSICGVIIQLYIFNSYFNKNPVKNWK